MREYVQGQRLQVKTKVEVEYPLRRLEYIFVHEDAPGETITISYEVNPSSVGSVEVLLDQEIPRTSSGRVPFKVGAGVSC